ncbi:hypothetical protein [Dyadobacter sp. CY343]|uniref:hypothetical protein n=1 Tax=Dyadobacter sp. CY343 TaxID=2907299 RepID=UPI001F2AAE82|nr:hypothetical protein [Dyadobacter sp. CY343]MCE7058714.1 hypothetical protein [Dyadobacter sp. CY343]
MNSLTKKQETYFQYAAGILTVLVIGTFYYIIVQNSINIPWFDDIENIPYFLVNWLEAPDFAGKWEAFIRPNNEHRVFTARLIVLAQYYLTSKLNFKDLLFCGNLSVLVLFLFIVRGYLRQGGKWYFILPVAFFVFNFQAYAGTFMTIMSMQYQMVIMLSVASFYLLVKQSVPAFIFAIAIACLDTFSMGNGMVVWPSGLAILLLQMRWKSSFIWLAAGAASIYLYFQGPDFVQGNDKAFSYVLEHPMRTFVAFFTMLGGDFDVMANAEFNKRMVIPTILGFILFAVFITWTVAVLSVSPFWGKWVPERWGRTLARIYNVREADIRWNAFWLAILAYVLIGMLMVVFFRTRFDPHIILWSTYKMYPAVMTSVIFIIVLQALNIRSRYRFFGTMCLVSAGLWWSTIHNYLPIVKNTSNARTAFAFNQKHNGVGLGATKNSAFETMLATTLRKVDSLGIYSLPRPLIHAEEDQVRLTGNTSQLNAKADIELEGDILKINLVSGPPADHRRYAFLESENNRYLFVFPIDGTETLCPVGTIRAGAYKLGIWDISSGNLSVWLTEQLVTIP